MQPHIDFIIDHATPADVLPGLSKGYWWGSHYTRTWEEKRRGQMQSTTVGDDGARWGDRDAAIAFCQEVAKGDYALAIIDGEMYPYPTAQQLADTVRLCREQLPDQQFFVSGYDFSCAVQFWEFVGGVWQYNFDEDEWQEDIAELRELVDLLGCVPAGAYCTQKPTFNTDFAMLKTTYDAIRRAWPEREMIVLAYGGRAIDGIPLDAGEVGRLAGEILPRGGRVALWGSMAESVQWYAALCLPVAVPAVPPPIIRPGRWKRRDKRRRR